MYQRSRRARFIRRLAAVGFFALVIFTVVFLHGTNANRDPDPDERVYWWETFLPVDNSPGGAGANATSQPEPDAQCRNTVQGVDLVTDSRGYVCARADVLGSGCCSTEPVVPKTLAGPEWNYGQFLCSTCDGTSQCCTKFEYCVSCCMHPQYKSFLESIAGQRVASPDLSTTAARFEACTALCRTSAWSVVNQQKFKSQHAKYCFTPNGPSDKTEPASE